MSDDLDALRHLRPDRVLPDDPGDPSVISRQKERLMALIDHRDDSGTAVRMPDVYPRLAYSDERAALDYLVRVFGFRELREARMEHGDHMLAWLRMGDGVVMISPANHDIHLIHSPRERGQATSMLNVAVHDVDAHYARAVAEGAEITLALQDAFYGERRYEATDLDGHRWHFAESFDAVRARGGEEHRPARQRRAEATGHEVADDPQGGLPD